MSTQGVGVKRAILIKDESASSLHFTFHIGFPCSLHEVFNFMATRVTTAVCYIGYTRLPFLLEYRLASHHGNGRCTMDMGGGAARIQGVRVTPGFTHVTLVLKRMLNFLVINMITNDITYGRVLRRLHSFTFMMKKILT